MIVVALIACVLLAVAAASAFAAYRLAGSHAWNRQYDHRGIGLAIELAFLFLTAAVAIAISIIMAESFKSLFLAGQWRSPLYLGAAAVMAAGVSFYALVMAPDTLARAQAVKAEEVAKECRLPYALYVPFSVVSWAGFVLPVIALIVVSIHSDYRGMAVAQGRLSEEGANAMALAESKPDAAGKVAGIYSLDYQGAIDTVERMVSRYLWVVGVFMIFVIVILNTHITSVFTEEAQDAFKWLMWALLAVAIGIGLIGLARFQVFRDIAIETQTRLYRMGTDKGLVELIASAKSALLALRNQGPTQFVKMTFDSGGLWLMFFGYAIQVVMAKVTQRSVVKVIFPGPVARFLDSFMLGADEG